MQTRVLLLFGTFVSIYGCATDASRIRLSVNQMLPTLHTEAPDVSIERDSAPELENTSVAASYSLVPVGNPYFFESQEYVIEPGERIGPRGDEICGLLAATATSDSSDAWKRYNIAIGAQLGLATVSVGTDFATVRQDFTTLRNMIFTAARLAQVPHSKVIIAIKGFADGQYAKWSRPLRNPPYNYERIAVLQPSVLGTLNPARYRSRESWVEIEDGRYDNSTLPDLRAEFVKHEFIEPFLSSCDSARVQVRILKGYEGHKVNRPLQRKVQIFVYLQTEDA
ncbi:MAG: hypothetical protein JWM27_1184 [Gemmatimonadetes bacterium]|nr:hypothetical protein [Gemmatimonadota bacterium]